MLTFAGIVSILLFASACGSDGLHSAPAPAAQEAMPEAAVDMRFGSRDEAQIFVEQEDIWLNDYAMPLETAAGAPGESIGAGAGQEYRPEVIIKSAFVELSTENFGDDKTQLESLTRQMGGFIESSNIFNEGNRRRFNVVLRVPAENFSELKAQIVKTGRHISSSENIQNVTGEYYDTQGRLEIKRIEEERILEMIGNAESVETILILEEQLGRVRTDIEIMQSWINNIDSLAAFSTITVNMTEGVNVRILDETGNFGQRLWFSFVASVGGTAAFFGNILVFLAGAVVPLALIAVLVFTGLYVGKKLNVFRRNDRAN